MTRTPASVFRQRPQIVEEFGTNATRRLERNVTLHLATATGSFCIFESLSHAELVGLSGGDVSQLSVPLVTSQRPGFQNCSDFLKVAQVNGVKGDFFFSEFTDSFQTQLTA